jgi:ABC-2 type transport system permease protein
MTGLLATALKELRELLRRPMLLLTLTVGPIAIMFIFGIGTDSSAEAPRAIVVIPPGQTTPRLLENHQREFSQFLSVQEYTTDEAYARIQLERNLVDAVVILPPNAYQTIAGGEQAVIRVLYSEIDPARRRLVPDFVRVMVGGINREIFLQSATEQQESLEEAVRATDLMVRALEEAEASANRGDREGARRLVREAIAASDQIDARLSEVGPEADPLGVELTRVRERLRALDQRPESFAPPPPPPPPPPLPQAEQRLATPDTRPASEQIGIAQTRRDLQALNEALSRLVTVPPEVAIAPITEETVDLSPIRSDIIAYFAPAALALLMQHAAVSLGALAFVRERLSGTFEVYAIAPTSPLRLLLGKYVAYFAFIFIIGVALVIGMLSPPLRVPLYGSEFRVVATLALLTLASTGLGFTLSLLAVSERQAVQLAMLMLLAVVFFSGIALPLDALKFPAIAWSYVLPATYGVALLHDVMLRGLPGDTDYLFALGAMAIGFFASSLALLHWRLRAR